jgi:2-keto-4-pentenoate hydratase/2-oxohepta-3-ene-1,7-dioic acid hydratase in catechol pathway
MFRLINHAGRAALDIDGQRHDLARLAGDASLSDPMAAVERHRDLHEIAQRAIKDSSDGPVDPTQLGPVVPHPQKVFAIGLNYSDHAAESNLSLPPAPLAFTKFPSCLVGPTSDVELRGDSVDWEVELVVVVGTTGRDIAAASVWDHVAGLTLGQDISDRKVQLLGNPPQFSLGKSFDTFGPIGPALVSVDSFADPNDIGLWCEISGERMQDGRSKDLIFDVPTLISYLSSICTLTPGDLVFTGTPSGVGSGRGRFLIEGDVIHSGAEVIGTLTNRCVRRAGA